MANIILSNEDKQLIKNSLNELIGNIKVEWDRIAESDEYLYVFGWIPRTDGQKDFLVYRFDKFRVCEEFITSSAKYTKQFMVNWNGNDEGHEDCIKFDEYFKDVI